MTSTTSLASLIAGRLPTVRLFNRWAWSEAVDPLQHGGNGYLQGTLVSMFSAIKYCVATKSGRLLVLEGIDVGRRGRLRARRVAVEFSWSSVTKYWRGRLPMPEGLDPFRLEEEPEVDAVAFVLKPEAAGRHDLILVGSEPNLDEWERLAESNRIPRQS